MSSKKISNFEAEKLAKDLTKGKRESISLIEKQLSEKMKTIIVSRIPDKIKEAFIDKKCIKYLQTTTDFKPVFNGQSFGWISVDVAIPDTNDYNLNLSEKEYKSIENLLNKKEKATHDLRKLKKELEIAFKGLGSFKRIIQQFPKAAEFLDTQANLLPQVNFDSLRAQLD